MRWRSISAALATSSKPEGDGGREVAAASPDAAEAEAPAGASKRDGAALGAALGMDAGARDHLTLLSGTAQNIVGLIVFVVGTFVANILVSRLFGGGAAGATALGIVTLGTQFAFIAAAGTRFGMDMAAVRYVAIDVGAGHPGRIRPLVVRAASIAGLASLIAAALTLAAASWLASSVWSQPGSLGAIRAAALALPFVALTFTYLGASRGLKIMRHTLYVQWVGQPLLWIALMLVLWAAGLRSVGMMVVAYAASWTLSTAAAWFLWEGEARRFPPEPLEDGATSTLVHYGAPRAPAALLSQGLFWVDWFVASAFVRSGAVTQEELGVYSASVRVALAMVLFLTAVSYVFSPFVADLHARGERERLDGLFKAITRWTVAGTIPILLLMLSVPGAILQIFGGEAFTAGVTPMRILLVGQAVNVSVGAAGFVLIMAGRTGWDLVVYGCSFVLDLLLSLLLVPRLGIEGAAIAQTTTIACSNAFRLYLVHRFVGIHPYNRHYFRLLIPAAACAVAMFAAAAVLSDAAWPVQLCGVATLGGAAYVVALVLFGLTPTEKAAATRLVRRRREAAAS
jgi:O-antigen/teichoic acid export membrane protein